MKQWTVLLRRSISDVQAKRPPRVIANAVEKSSLTSDEVEEHKRRLYRLIRSDPQKAHGLMADLEARHQPSLHMFNVLLRGRIMLRDTEGIRGTLVAIVKAGFAFNAVTVSLLLSYYRDLDRMEEAEKLFKAVLARARPGQAVQAAIDEHSAPFINCPGPNLSAYTTMISGWARRCNYAKVCEYFEELEQREGLKPDEHLLGTMLNAAVDAKDTLMVSRMQRLLHAKDGLSLVSLKALLRANVLLDGSEEKMKSYLRMITVSLSENDRDLLEMSELLQWGLQGGSVALRRAFACIEYIYGKQPLARTGDLHTWNVVLENIVELEDWDAFARLVWGSRELRRTLGSRMLSKCPDSSLVMRIRDKLDQIDPE